MSDVVSNLASQPDSACASEPIHIPGGVQPHGVLFAIDENDRVLQVSESVEAILGIRAEAALDRPLSKIIGASAASMVRAAVHERSIDGAPLYVGAIDRLGDNTLSGGPFALIVHRHNGATVVELEPARGTVDVFASMYPLVRDFVNDLQQQRSVDQLCKLAANEIQRITGFGRTLVYRFDEKDTGTSSLKLWSPDIRLISGSVFPHRTSRLRRVSCTGLIESDSSRMRTIRPPASCRPHIR